MQGLDDVEQLASGFSSSCAVSATGTVACWGQNYNGQLGNGSTTSSPVPVDVAGITTAVSVSIKDSHACALLADTTVKCWGRNGEGQLGDGTTTDSPTPVAVSDLSGVASLAAGFEGTCAILSDGTVRCWGSNQFAFLGGGSTDPYSTVPVTVPGIGTAVEVSSGYQICVRLANHSVICWGIIDADAYSAAATTEGGGGSAPALVPGITDAAALTEGMFSQCAVRLNHKVACWGLAMMGGLGNGHSPILTSPDLPAQGLTDATAVASGSLFSCALRATKAVMCWGVGPFGDGATSQYKASFVPSSVPGATDITAFDVGSEHGCAVITGGAVKCLGRNDYGQLGDGSTDDSYLAMLNVSGISDASSVATGRSHSCALRAGGTVACWGHNGDRQLGDGTTDNSANPVTVDGVSNATQIAAGRDSTCARIADGTVFCWGYGLSGPSEVTGISTATQVTVGRDFACALLADHTVDCWGGNGDHQLGDGTTNDSSTPVVVGGLSDATAVDAGDGWACALVDGGSVRCWGGFMEMIRPSGSTDPTLPVAGITGATDITVGEVNACVALTDGTASCWGYEWYGSGAFGDGEGPVGHGQQKVASDVVGLDGVWTGLPDPPTDEPPTDDPPADDPPADDPPVDEPPVVVNPTPNPGPKPPTPRVLPPTLKPAATVRLVGNKLTFSNYIMASRIKACPRRVTITVRAGSRSARLHSPKVKRIGKTCRLNGSVAVPRAFTKSRKIKVSVSGNHLRQRTAIVPRTLS